MIIKKLLIFSLLVGCSCFAQENIKTELESKIVAEKYIYGEYHNYRKHLYLISKDGYYCEILKLSKFAKIRVGQEYTGEWKND